MSSGLFHTLARSWHSVKKYIKRKIDKISVQSSVDAVSCKTDMMLYWVWSPGYSEPASLLFIREKNKLLLKIEKKKLEITWRRGFCFLVESGGCFLLRDFHEFIVPLSLFWNEWMELTQECCTFSHIYALFYLYNIQSITLLITVFKFLD